MSKKINIGITLQVEDYKTSSFFSNGIKQNIITLREVFENCKNVNKSYIINTSSKFSAIAGTHWEKYAEYIITKEEAKKKCDLIVEAHGSLLIDEYKKYKKLGKKIVKQVLGAELAMFNERVLFNIPAGGIYKKNNDVDATWISPHFYERDKHFFECLYECNVLEAPYIWDSRFINMHIESLKKNKQNFTGTYAPNGNLKKRISTMEANLSVVKTCITPIIIAELLERKYPEVLEFFSIFGGEKIKNKPDMIDFVLNFEVNKNKKCFFESRYPVVWTLFNHTDIVLSHQNQNELNYLYLDAAWLGFPVVHNSPMMRELGWYYPDNNADVAIEHIKYIAENFDTIDYVDEKYLKKSRQFAERYFPSNIQNIKEYERLIENVIA